MRGVVGVPGGRGTRRCRRGMRICLRLGWMVVMNWRDMISADGWDDVGIAWALIRYSRPSRDSAFIPNMPGLHGRLISRRGTVISEARYSPSAPQLHCMRTRFHDTQETQQAGRMRGKTLPVSQTWTSPTYSTSVLISQTKNFLRRFRYSIGERPPNRLG